MKVGDDRRYRKTPLEAKSQVNDDADDYQQERQGAVFREFLANLRADELDSTQRRARCFGGEGLHHGFADLGRVLLGLEGQANQNILAGAEVLYREIGVTRLAKAVADLLQIGRLRIVEFDQCSARELDRKMQATAEEEEHCQQEGQERDDVEHQRMPHERDVFADPEKFHLCVFLFGRAVGRFPDLTDGQRFDLAPTAVDQVDQRP